MKRAAWIPCLVVITACGGSQSNRTVFDPASPEANVVAVEVVSPTGVQLETPFPALDGPQTPGPKWIGVSVLGGGVRLSRPERWTIRDASTDPDEGYVRYVSPSAYSFAIYARRDSPSDSWRDIEQRYEADVVAAGAKAVGQRIAMATGTNQGRAYTIERAAPAPSRSREILLRSEHRVVLVQVVDQDADLSRVSAELLKVLDRIEVL